jgi:hypothetical protein
VPLTNRILGVIRAPWRTMTAVINDPRWGAVLLLTLCLTAGARIGLMTTDIGQQALTDQWEARIEAFGRTVDDATYARLEQLGQHGWQLAAGTSLASGLLLPFVLAAVLHGVFGRGRVNQLVAQPLSYQQSLAVVVHANVILALRDVVAAPVSYLRESLGSPLALGTLFRMLDEGSAAARLFAMVDFFILWWVVVLAIGTAALYRRSTRTLALTYMGVYGAFAVVMAGIMVFSGGE